MGVSTWRPPQQAHVDSPEWNRLPEAERRQVCEWLRSVGWDPSLLRGYMVQGDGLLVEVICQAGGAAHLRCNCPAPEAGDSQLADTLCTYMAAG